MGRQPCCDKIGLKKGPWTAEEDKRLVNFILTNGQCCWRGVPKLAGLLRCGKSCRLRWTNYLRPDLKRGLLSEYEEKIVVNLHAQLGNRWSKIASHLHGRTDNEIKNHWNTHIKKKLKKLGIDPLTHKPLPIFTSDQIPQEQQEDQQMSPSNETEPSSVESSVTEANEELNAIEKSLLEIININGFCTDEVPLIGPHEINLVSSCSTSTSSSSSSNIIQEFKFPDFDWQCDVISSLDLWDDDFSSTLDLLMNGDSDRSNVTLDPRMVSDQES